MLTGLIPSFTVILASSVFVVGCRTQAVVSHLVELYWAPLWAWLVSDREGILKASEVI